MGAVVGAERHGTANMAGSSRMKYVVRFGWPRRSRSPLLHSYGNHVQVHISVVEATSAARLCRRGRMDQTP